MVWSGLVMVSRVVPLYYLTPVSPYCYVKYWGSDLTVVTPGQIWSFNNLDNWIYTSDDIWWYLRYPSICWINKIKRNLCSSASNHHTCFSSSPPTSLAEEKFGQVEFVEYTTVLQHGIYMYTFLAGLSNKHWSPHSLETTKTLHSIFLLSGRCGAHTYQQRLAAVQSGKLLF